MRFRESCPDCGFILDDFAMSKIESIRTFDCPRCNSHWTLEDFDAEMREKLQAQFHNMAKADLNNEI